MQRHLLPKALSEHGITDDACKVGNDALTSIIRSYTREDGVRNLSEIMTSVDMRPSHLRTTETRS